MHRSLSWDGGLVIASTNIVSLAKGLSMKRASFIPVLALAAALPAQGVFAQTLKTVQDRGAVSCGVSQGLPGFSNPDDKGNWTGLDVEMCRAVAAAVLNDPAKVKFVPLSAKDRFTALQSGEVDLLARNTTWTLNRDTQLGFNFTGVNYYDGQGFMVRKALKVNSALELNSASVCVQTGTTTEQNLADYFKANNMKYEVIAFANADETLKAYENGRCDAFTTDASGLYSFRLKLAVPADHIVLPEIISKEPLGPVVRHGDDQWFDIVKWTQFAMLNAEELGVTQKNVDEMLKSDKPDIKRLLGTDSNMGEQLGLTKDWVVRIVKAVGNYGESFERNVGANSPLQISRGLNRLWNKGGIQYAPPVR
jgi:general L-amino acid transport system substrate-binding protein